MCESHEARRDSTVLGRGSDAWAICSTYHTTLQSTPGQLVFGHDMIWDIAHVADWQYIKQCKQTLINKNNERENHKRIDYDYTVSE